MRFLVWAIQWLLAVPLLVVWLVLFACSIGAGGALIYAVVVGPETTLPAWAGYAAAVVGAYLLVAPFPAVGLLFLAERLRQGSSWRIE